MPDKGKRWWSAVFRALRKAVSAARARLMAKGGSASLGDGSCVLQPSELMQKVLDEAARKGMSWSDAVELPTAYEVHVSAADWDCFYGLRTRSTEKRLAEAVEMSARSMGALMETAPTVRLQPDASLQEGSARIVATFGSFPKKAAAEGARPSRGGSVAFGAKLGATKLMEGAIGSVPFSCVTRRMDEDDLSAIPWAAVSSDDDSPSQRASVASGGSEFDVFSGMTIGAARVWEEPLPDIALEGDDARYVSQIHGTFWFENGAWVFSNQGRCGTRVLRDGAWHEMEDGWWGLEDGDELSLAWSDPVRFTCGKEQGR